FHLDSSFSDEKGIYADKKEFFKSILSNLQLTSIGFVANTEAVVGAKLEESSEHDKQMIVELTTQHTLFSLFEKKSLLDSVKIDNTKSLDEQFKQACLEMKEYLPDGYVGEASEEVKDLPMLPVTLISSLVTTEELNTKKESFPEELPLKLSYIGSDIILPLVTIPGATAIAKSKGWLVSKSVDDTAGSDDEVVNVEEKEVAESKKDKKEEKEDVAEKAEKEEVIDEKPMESEKSEKSRVITNDELMADVNDGEDTKPKKPTNPKPFIIGGVIFGVLALAAIIFYIVVGNSTATITIQPREQTISKEIVVTIDPSVTTSDIDNLVLAATTRNETFDEVVSIPTTGRTTTGERATGTVTLVNKGGSGQTLAAGTILTIGDVRFTLNEEVHVSGATDREDGSGREFTTREAQVTAETYGESGNINERSILRIGNFDLERMEARAHGNFSGGTTREINVVSEADMTNALQELTAQAEETASDMRGRDGERYDVPMTSNITIADTTYSAEVGDEESELVLTAVVTVPIITYDSNDLQPLVAAILEQETPEGFVLVGEPELMSALNDVPATSTATSQSLTLDVNLRSRAVADIDFDEIRDQLLGQTILRAENILRDISEVRAFEITWSNDLYATLFGNLPSNADKLEVRLYNDEE
ncbi:MAG: hypothetical protein LBG64_04120, partial [Pseudomonadales bacterium]|nr:hypothetical protein [Pseudomonadales bacterium]